MLKDYNHVEDPTSTPPLTLATSNPNTHRTTTTQEIKMMAKMMEGQMGKSGPMGGPMGGGMGGGMESSDQSLDELDED